MNKSDSLADEQKWLTGRWSNLTHWQMNKSDSLADGSATESCFHRVAVSDAELAIHDNTSCRFFAPTYMKLTSWIRESVGW